MSQLERVRKQLLKTGRITRNQCLSTHPAITRLSAIILNLKEQGYEFETEDTKKDYIYTLKNAPVKKVVYRVPELGKEIITHQ